jgi:alkanesulfonate monooxygenase SsuD/methylene tetrahydromethanopterin reductase-like flavin-dependent oxidoreductase (luciferase family)
MGASPLVIGSAIAARTRTLRIGTAVILLALHHPVQVIEDVATLDLLSGGRVDVGVSRGARPLYFDGFGVPPEERKDRFQESLDLMRKAWTHDRLSYDGKYYKVPDVAFRPSPVQKPHPPIYVASYDLDHVRECAAEGLLALEGGVEPPSRVKAKIDAFNTGWAEGGQAGPPPEVPVSRTLYVGETDESAWRDVEGYLRTAYDTRMQRTSTIPFEVESRETAVIGSPETVLKRLIELHDECGVRYLNVLLHSFWYVPASLMRASMRRLALEVMPHFSS